MNELKALKRQKKLYFRPITMEPAEIPWSRENAAALKLTVFMADCGVCNGPRPHFVSEGECVDCAKKRIRSKFEAMKMSAALSGSLFPTDRMSAAQLGLNWFYGGADEKFAPMCNKGPHLRVSNVDTGRCIECEKLGKKSPAYDRRRATETRPADMVISREEARSKGRTTFRTGRPCAHGHIGYRYVSTGSCVDCLAGEPELVENLTGDETWRGSNRVERDPDLILTRAQAFATGAKTYRTGDACKYGHRGHRWTSTGGCVDCLAGMPSPSDWTGQKR